VPAALSADNYIWCACRFCHKAIWRKKGTRMWRDSDGNHQCSDAPSYHHWPEH
jgi:hypothetical protein